MTTLKKAILPLFLLAVSVQAANEVRVFVANVTTPYMVIRETDGDVWYTAGDSFEPWGTDGNDAADYDIALTDKGGDMFLGTFDPNVGDGFYYVAVHSRVGEAPADSDPVVETQYGYWDGTTFATTNTPVEIAVATRTEIDVNSTVMAAIQAMTDLMAVVTTTVATPNDANTFTITAGADVNDAYWMHAIMVQDANDSHKEVRWIEEYVTSRDVTVDEPFSFTPAAADKVWILGPVYGGLLYELRSSVSASQSPVYYFDETGKSGRAGGTNYYNDSGKDP